MIVKEPTRDTSQTPRLNRSRRISGTTKEARGNVNIEARGVIRTLTLLRYLNRNNCATVSEIFKTTGISRPALYRILDAMIESGHVARGHVKGTYVLTSLVRELSDGFKEEDWISELAAPVLSKLQQKVLWPTELATLHNTRMYLRDSTRRQSPLVIDGETVGRDIPVLETSLGMAFIAHCSFAERQNILHALGLHPTDKAHVRRLEAAFKEIRRKGYASRYKGVIEGTLYQTSSIAVPIVYSDAVLAAICITFIASALSVEDAVARYLAALQDASLEISNRISKADRSKALGLKRVALKRRVRK